MVFTPPATREATPLKTLRSQHQQDLGHAQLALKDWHKLHDLKNGSMSVVDGNSLDIADIVGVAKYGTGAKLSQDPTFRVQIERSIETLNRHLRNGHLVYGVTTGFGGSADSRTTDTGALQGALVQHQNSGVLTSKDIKQDESLGSKMSTSSFQDFDAEFDVQSMPTSWIRASMLTRCNSIIRGHSAVRGVIAETILSLLRHEITPIVPLRGSISASGDLSPLSYIAGAIEGNPDIHCRIGKGTNVVLTADKALEKFSIEPIILRAKEGLGLLNGTAFSAATASLALHQSQQFAILSQALTAMGVEALCGTVESFSPRIAEMRPHPGQIEAAANIFSFLQHSRLAVCVKEPNDTKMSGLYQDRYALRTSSQWLAPQLEDLHHAQEQLLVEINSTTDNPLVDYETDHIHHGGNFQAAVVTSTMDRTRLALDKIGRMLFAQATEMINPMLNNGLPANLASDDPSLSFTCKGVDINMAAYASELAHLANPVGNHVMSAEMHNQAINSVALISSRYTFQALDTLRILCAAYLFTVCQALDLRVQQVRFLKGIQSLLYAHLESCLPALSSDSGEELANEVWKVFTVTWPEKMTLDLADRASKTAECLIPVFISHLAKSSQPADLSAVIGFTTSAALLMVETYTQTQQIIESDRLTIVPSYLGRGAGALYKFVRSPIPNGLGVAFFRGLHEHPTQPVPNGWTQQQASDRKTIGSRISVIYEALRDGRVDDVVMRVVEDNLSVVQ